jgi:hypothetical protein
MTPKPRPGAVRRAPGRRVAAAAPTRPSRLSLVLAVSVPLVTLLAITLTDGSQPATRAGVPPTDSALTSQQLVCPAAAGELLVASTRATGEQRVTQNATSRATGLDDAVVVDGRGDLAPGLVATRADAARAAAVGCGAPQPEYWFTGAGAASIHSSVLELVNSDAGPAVADIEVRNSGGLMVVDALRGITVPGGSAVAIDLSSTVPARRDLSVHVTVNRGRLGASMLDQIADTAEYADWLAPQAVPATDAVLLGLVGGIGEHQLILSNPAEEQARVEVKVIGSDSTFLPVGQKEISVPPQSTVVVDLADTVRTATAKQEAGLQITSTIPVTAGLRSVTGKPVDLSHAVSAVAVSRSATLLPPGRATLVLAAPNESGSATVTSYDVVGKELASTRVAVKRLTSTSLLLPQKASLVVVKAVGPALPGAIRVVGTKGAMVLQLTELALTAPVAALTPGSASVQSAQPSR